MSNDETIPVRPGEHLNGEKLETYLRQHLTGIQLSRDALQVRQFPSGASNLTYLLRIGSWEGVLRRPPLGPIAPKAHDMQREANLLEKISSVFPLAPRPYLFCEDNSVLGTPFYIMERRQGIVLNDTFPPTVQASESVCRNLSYTVIDTLVEIHAIDWQQIGLDALGHPTGFLERQVKSWIERYQRAQTDDIPQVETLSRWFLQYLPASPAPTLIHNDFKLNNLLLNVQDITRVEAVLDWEMATIGDPLFDLAITLAYWILPDDPRELQTLLPTVTTRAGFLQRRELAERYAQQSGRNLDTLFYYMPLAYFKLAGILQQIYVRWKRGQTSDPRFAAFGAYVRALILHAASLIEYGHSNL